MVGTWNNPRHTASAESDSSGIPWHGRSLNPQPFAGDEGNADPVLAESLAAWARGEVDEYAVVASLATARLMVAVGAAPAELGDSATGLPADVIAEMALLTVIGADGHQRLPVFTCRQNLATWGSGLAAEARAHGGVRPVAVEAGRAAQAAVAESCVELLLDPAGPVPFTIVRPALWALGQGRVWMAPEGDDQVKAAVDVAVSGFEEIAGVRCERSGVCTLIVVLGVHAGLDQGQLGLLVEAVGARLGASQLITERVDGIRIKVLTA